MLRFAEKTLIPMKKSLQRQQPNAAEVLALVNSVQSVGEYALKGITASDISEGYRPHLKKYSRLSGLSRNRSVPAEVRALAGDHVFGARVTLERSMLRAMDRVGQEFSLKVQSALDGAFFGCSGKQGVSLRMPLSTCMPTRLCAGGCYAHDALDATPNALIRGVLNGWLAAAYENGTVQQRATIESALQRPVHRAVRAALQELTRLPAGYRRRAFIRFSHVGEVAAFPQFANSLANQIIQLSGKRVDCVIYTRHRDAAKLDPKLFVINFTLDPASFNRRKWIPESARIVFSAFGGVTSGEADVNFLEHHRHIHMARTAGNGRICPATLPETKERTCDACRCDRCFVAPIP
jgi:hypothetical protein